MSNKLNYSNLDDAWGIPELKESKSEIDQPLTKRFNYQKPSNKENILTINSNEISKPLKHGFKPVQETYTDYIKPCDLVSHHVHNCEICRKNLIKSLENFEQKQETNNKIENFIPNTNIIETYNSFDLNESFENISPSQKNLLIVILYGILIILISDLIIKEE
jgi:hypothetical protein